MNLSHREDPGPAPGAVAIHRRVVDGFAALAMTVMLFFATPAEAQTFPPLTGRVVDQAQLLTPEQVQDLTSKSAALEAQKGAQLVIATVNSLEGRPVEDYGYQLGRAWGIGQKGKDNGVILLVAPNEHRVRIEVGYGATPYLTDAMSGLIIREDITPRFKQGDMGGGIEAGADAIVKQMSLSPDEAQKNIAAAEQAQQRRHRSGGSPLPFFFWLMVIGFVLLSHFRRGYGRRYRHRQGGISPWVVLWGLNELSRSSRRSSWDGGSSWSGGGGWGGGGGGFGGFSGGGGSFGGGGASGSW